jgi:hypothetical protein
MREFIALNKRIFPVYFGCQVGLASLTAATRPPYSILSLAKDLWGAAPLGVVLVMGSLNWFVYGPRTTTASLIRRALHGKFPPLWYSLLSGTDTRLISSQKNKRIRQIRIMQRFIGQIGALLLTTPCPFTSTLLLSWLRFGMAFRCLLVF